MKRKPDPILLDRYKVKIQSDTVFRSHARLLQSIWREEKGYPIGEYTSENEKVKLGNLIEKSFAETKKANYITGTIGDIVKREVSRKGKLIQTPRIWTNLLSSQPLAFNLFGEMQQEGYQVATSLFQKILGEEIGEVIGLEFEYSPGRNDPKYLNDKTAFDVFVIYKTPSGNSRFVGIEVKYAEDMKGGKASYKPNYEEVAKAMGVFNLDSNRDVLLHTNIQQIWRDHLLAGSMFITNKDYEEGTFMLLYPKDNYQCSNAIEKYKKTLKPTVAKSYFYDITIETLIEELEKISHAKWVADFKDRYLSFHKLNK